MGGRRGELGFVERRVRWKKIRRGVRGTGKDNGSEELGYVGLGI